MKIKAWLTTLLFTLFSATALAATEGVDYEKLPKTMPQTQSSKVEVLEFFAFWCPHCRDLEPILSRHSKTFASDTYLRREHVVWDPQNDLPFARLAAATELAGVSHSANTVIFDAVIKERIHLGKSDILQSWLNKQTRFNGKKVLQHFQSFSSQSRAKQMADNTAHYDISGTPSVIVGGKYRVTFTNGFEAGMKTIDELIVKVRQERGLKAAVPKVQKPLRSQGVRVVKQSNR